MFINRLPLTSDAALVYQEVNNLIDTVGWGPKNQVCLTHREGSTTPWHEGAGSLYDSITKKFLAEETDFNLWNIPQDSYIRQQLEKLIDSEQFDIGRIRIMRLLPKTGLSVHSDRERRYHLVLKTNQFSYMAEDFSLNNNVNIRAICHHIPLDNHWYRVDTRKQHWVYNGGPEERIHLVVSGK